MDELARIILLGSLVACLLGPSVLSFMGLGSRGKWLGAGIGGLLGFAFFEISYRRASPMTIWGPDWNYLGPPLGGLEGFWLALSFGFILAAAAYRPRKRIQTIRVVGKGI